MRIIITGAGDVGYHLAKMLASDSQDIYLIDQDEERLNYVQSHIDIYTVLGDAASPEILKEAKVESCDLLIAVTSSEKTNLLVSVIAKRFGAKQTIARISEIENLDDENRDFLTTGTCMIWATEKLPNTSSLYKTKWSQKIGPRVPWGPGGRKFTPRG